MDIDISTLSPDELDELIKKAAKQKKELAKATRLKINSKTPEVVTLANDLQAQADMLKVEPIILIKAMMKKIARKYEVVERSAEDANTGSEPEA